VFPPVGLVLVLMISAIIGPPIRLILMDSAGCLPVGRFRGKADLRGRVASTASVAPGAGLFLWGGDRRVKASGDELVSLGFRVGNPQEGAETIPRGGVFFFLSQAAALRAYMARLHRCAL
jgi:hypothetical protein